jgi:hypothetical protein
LLLPALLTGCSLQVHNSETSNPELRATEPPPPAPPRRLPRAAGTPPPTTADGIEEETDEQAWAAIAAALAKPGELKGGVYRVVFPRNDLEVTIEGNAVPAAAGVASEFRFYRCPCGRINVMGQFVVADHEANDVIDALRAGQVEVASVGPLLLHERPRLLLIRFFGENKSGGALAKTLRAALAWTGQERMAPQKMD